jgi:hypothetical protein
MTVLALNQVTTTVSPDYQNDMTAVNSDCFSLQPALGQTWTACVNTRLMLTRSSCGPARIAEVVFAPHLPRRRKLRFHLLPDGSIQFEYDVETTASDINC